MQRPQYPLLLCSYLGAALNIRCSSESQRRQRSFQSAPLHFEQTVEILFTLGSYLTLVGWHNSNWPHNLDLASFTPCRTPLPNKRYLGLVADPRSPLDIEHNWMATLFDCTRAWYRAFIGVATCHLPTLHSLGSCLILVIWHNTHTDHLIFTGLHHFFRPSLRMRKTPPKRPSLVQLGLIPDISRAPDTLGSTDIVPSLESQHHHLR